MGPEICFAVMGARPFRLGPLRKDWDILRSLCKPFGRSRPRVNRAQLFLLASGSVRRISEPLTGSLDASMRRLVGRGTFVGHGWGFAPRLSKYYHDGIT